MIGTPAAFAIGAQVSKVLVAVWPTMATTPPSIRFFTAADALAGSPPSSAVLIVILWPLTPPAAFTVFAHAFSVSRPYVFFVPGVAAFVSLFSWPITTGDALAAAFGAAEAGDMAATASSTASGAANF